MIAVALWISGLFASLALATAVVKAALEFTEPAKAESLGFVRLTLTGIFGVTIGQALTPVVKPWWLSAIVAVVLMTALLFGSQFAAKYLGHKNLGRGLAKVLKPAIDSISLLFTPISLPKLDVPDEDEQELHESVEDFSETIVREIMVPRIDMATIDSDVTLEKAMSLFLSRGYSRLPVIGKNIDDVVGILYVKDVAKIQHETPQKMADTQAVTAARPVIFVPESKPVDDLLKDMQLSTKHIAIVVDEYGGVAGLVTMEDVIEEIVGEINDEYDRERAEVEDLGDGSYRVNARYSLFELGELLALELEDEDVDSIGGLLAKELGRLPGRGDTVTVSGIEISVDRIEGRRKRLSTVLIKKHQDSADAQTAFEVLDES